MSLGRPAIRRRESRIVINTLAEHHRLMLEFEAQGHDRETASKMAYDVIQQRKRDAHNKARRERHAALTSLGLKRVKGNLGGTYYE